MELRLATDLRLAGAACSVAFLLSGPAASGQEPSTPAPPPAPPPPQVAGQMKLTPERVGGRSATVFAGATWRVRGVVEPYVPGQRVTVRFYRGRSKIKVKQVDVLPSATGQAGYFLVSFRTSKPGRVTVRASHRATPELGALTAHSRTVNVVALRAGYGSRGALVRQLQRRLKAKRFVVAVTGVYDDRTARAVMAFRKLSGLRRLPTANREVFRRLARGAGTFRVRFPSHGRHVEASLGKQVLALIGRGGRVERIYPTSSGAPATPTILGSFRVYSKAAGTNSLGMFMSSYFIRGYAIHGYPSVPPYPASHGCLRVPMADAVSIFNWIHYGTRVDTYY
jgi:peptidoglycan hydrolase-like protein with peptidoglycan-binding domain